ncbi:hypothetical protein E2320_017414, partial [Naja naja]
MACGLPAGKGAAAGTCCPVLRTGVHRIACCARVESEYAKDRLGQVPSEQQWSEVKGGRKVNPSLLLLLRHTQSNASHGATGTCPCAISSQKVLASCVHMRPGPSVRR